MSIHSTTLLMRSFNLSFMSDTLEKSIAKAEKENWSYEDFLSYLFENEIHWRKNRKVERLLKSSKLPESKSLTTLNMDYLPADVKKKLPSLLEGNFVEKAMNVLSFGLPGRGKTHFLCAIGRELIMRYQYNVLFTPTFKIIQNLQLAKEKHELEKALKKFDSYDVIIIDDIGYVQHSREEMEVFFTFLADRYERKSLMISSNLPFAKWENIFKDPMTAMAAIDRLVHHSVIIEFDNDSIRTKQAVNSK